MRDNFAAAVLNRSRTRGKEISYRGGVVDQVNLNTLTGGVQKCVGMIKEGEGRFVKSKGHQLKKTIGNDVVTLCQPWTGEYYAIAYGTTTGFWHPPTDTVTTIKTDHASSDPFTGDPYANLFYIGNGGEKVGKLTMTLAYDNQSANFTVGKTITGGTSGATATIVADNDAGATGTLTLRDVVGVFEDDEEITDDNGTPGTADVNGVLSGAYTELSNAPYAKVIRVGRKEIYAGNILGTSIDPSSVWVSQVDSGSGIPDTWTEGVDLGDPYRVRWGGAGGVTDIQIKDKLIVVLHENGRHGYQLVFEADGSGGIDQRVEDLFFNNDYGGYRGAKSTKYGIIYTNPHGVYLMRGGQGDIIDEVNLMDGYSKEEIEKYDFSDSDIEFLPTQDLAIITARKESATNNAVLFYNMRYNQLSERTGCTFSRLTLTADKQSLYATDATEGKLYHFLNGFDDAGKDIYVEMGKSEAFGDVKTAKMAEELLIHATMGQESTVQIALDVWDMDFKKQLNAYQFEMTFDGVFDTSNNGYNLLGYNEIVSGGEGVATEVIGHITLDPFLFTKIRWRIVETSMLPFELHEVSYRGVTGVRGVHKQTITPTT